MVKHIYTSIDIGSDSIKVVTAELYRGKLNLLAASSTKSKGIKKGLITDVNDVTISLKKGIKEIEDMLGIKIKKVITNIPSYFADFAKIDGEIKISNEDNIITGSDVSKVFLTAMKPKLSSNKEMVAIIPIDFAVDSKTGIKDPKGMQGNVLRTRSIMVSTPKKNIYSVVSLIENLGIEVCDISINSIGDMNALKFKDIEEQIGAIINIGSETTTISIYNKEILIKNSIIGIGGRNIDNDIAYMYKIDSQTANRIKEKFALAHKKYANVNEILKLQNETIIDQLEVSKIAMSRIEEILNLAKKEINDLTNREMDYIIITGGTSNMNHFELIAEEVFPKNVTIGNMKLVGVRNNKYSSAIGNIVYFINKLKVKGKDYTMITEEDNENISSTKKNFINVSNESMLGKVFGYFFDE